MREEVKDTFDEKSPITGEMSVLVEDNIRLDFSSGYQNMKDLWHIDNEDGLSQIEENLPTYIQSYKVVDEEGYVWYPMMAFKHTATLFPIPVDDSFAWAVSKVEKLVNKDDINTHYVVNLPTVVNGQEQAVLYKVSNEPEHVFAQKDFDSAFELYNSYGNGGEE